MIRERWGAIERRKTSLPPPGLECVTSVTTVVRFGPAHETPVATVVSRIVRIAAARRVTSAEYMTGPSIRMRRGMRWRVTDLLDLIPVDDSVTSPITIVLSRLAVLPQD